ncbi:MAG: hypothetical protein AAF433_15590 [Bacteroidota bacterium]
MRLFQTTILASVSTLLFLIGTACPPAQPQEISKDYEQLVRQQAEEYFATFAERSDWDKLCSFYREDLVFRDIMLQIDLDSLWQFKRFYKWDEEGEPFQKLTPEQEHLTLTSLAVDSNLVVGCGRINPFYYDGHLIESEWGMDFSIWLYFDENLKIMEQHDWMEYDPFALQSVIDRCQEFGHEATPQWLDLSR